MKLPLLLGLPLILAVTAMTWPEGERPHCAVCQPYADKCPACKDCTQCHWCSKKGGTCSTCSTCLEAKQTPPRVM